MVQNDDSLINTAKPFEPFGLNPSESTSFYFTHPEIYFKNLSELNVNFEWLDLPSNFVSHYTNYNFPKLNGEKYQTFEVAVELIDKSIVAKKFGKKELFGTKTNNKATLSFNNNNTISLTEIGSLSNYEANYNEDSEVFEQGRYIKLELCEPDFQHGEYQSVSSRVGIEFAKFIIGKSDTNKDDYLVNPPYTPKLKKMLLSYKASTLIRPEDKGNNQDKIFQIYSYGYKEINQEDTFIKITEEGQNNLHVDVIKENSEEDQKLPKFYLLPQFNNEGELFIGLENADPPQNLSLLFQMAEGSANPDVAPPQVQWWYLSNNQWKTFDDGKILHDSTNGLIQTGIITLNIPSDANSGNTLLAKGLHWIKASVKQDTIGLCDAVEILSQAVGVIRIIQENDSDNLSESLPGGSINQLKTAISEIKSIKQPYNSTGGKLPESTKHFHLRTSERLRHKNRAITAWDYERLVLEKFPNIYKVKCLAACTENEEDPFQNDPGKVILIVVPDIRNKVPFNPFEPKVPSDQLFAIKQFLEQRMPPWANLEIKNPRYIQVKIKAFVRFKQGYNEGYFKNKLNHDLLEFLAPWAFDNSAEIVFGNKIQAGSIINFIDKREYIEFVGKINIFQKNNNDYFEEINFQQSGGNTLNDMADAILVSAKEHYIHTIIDEDYDEKQYAGIEFMRMELDFMVN